MKKELNFYYTYYINPHIMTDIVWEHNIKINNKDKFPVILSQLLNRVKRLL